MAYTLATLRNRVLDDKLDDTSFDPNIVDRFLNDAQRAVFNTYELPFMEKVFVGLLPSGGTIYTFPDDYQIEQSMVLTDPSSVRRDLTDNYVDFRTFNSQYYLPTAGTPGTPSVWTIHGNKMYIDKPTDQNYTLTLFYLKSPDTMENDNDVPEIPEAFSEVLVLGAYYRILQRNEDFDLALSIKNGDYTDELEKMVERLGKRQTGKAMSMANPTRVARSRRRRM